MNTNFKSFIEWLKSKPLYIKITLPLLVAVAFILSISSCAPQRVLAKVTNKATGTNTSISISGTSGSSVNVQASPDVQVQFDSIDTIKPSKIKSNGKQ